MPNYNPLRPITIQLQSITIYLQSIYAQLQSIYNLLQSITIYLQSIYTQLQSNYNLTPASRCTSSPGITCVSSSLTGGTGSGFIDGDLGMWWSQLCGWTSRRLVWLLVTCIRLWLIVNHWTLTHFDSFVHDSSWLLLTRSDSYPYYRCVLGSLRVEGSVYPE